jgi:hypothetical protein
VIPTGPFELVKERPWATVWRVPLQGGVAYAKACRPIQAFEPALTAALARRWPDRVAEVLAFDPARAWLLTADAGTPVGDLGNPPELWAEILPRYAELQRGEIAHAAEHIAIGLPDLGLHAFPERFDELLARDLPIDSVEVEAARRLRPNLVALADELAAAGIGDSVEHADLHLRSVFRRDGRLRILDWGDASVAHPFFSLVVAFAFLRDINGLAPDDPWFDRLRDAYLEPWGSGLVHAFEIAQRLGTVSRGIGWGRHHASMGPGAFPGFDEQFPGVLRTAIHALRTTLPA